MIYAIQVLQNDRSSLIQELERIKSCSLNEPFEDGTKKAIDLINHRINGLTESINKLTYK